MGIGFFGWAYLAMAQEGTLISIKVKFSPKISGKVDSLWGKARALKIPLEGQSGNTNLWVRSVFTNTHIYFLFQWVDPTQDTHYQPWIYDGDTWKQDTGKRLGEDKLALLWNINDSIGGFNQQGCSVLCHATTPGRDKPLMYTNAPNERGDLWVWRAARTNPLGQLEDQFLDNDIQSEAAGLKGDSKEDGGHPNVLGALPKFSWKKRPKNPNFLFKDEGIEIKDHKAFLPGTILPGWILNKFIGERADIKGKALWKDGMWTLEVGRKLNTGHSNDVQFTDLTKEYYFSVAIFDRSEPSHALSQRPYKLIFEKPK